MIENDSPMAPLMDPKSVQSAKKIIPRVVSGEVIDKVTQNSPNIHQN